MANSKKDRVTAESSEDVLVLEELSQSEDPGIRYAVASNSNTSISILEKLATDPIESVANAAKTRITAEKIQNTSGTEKEQTSTFVERKSVGFNEKDDIATLEVWGVWNIFLGIAFAVIGLLIGFSQLSSYYGMPIPFFIVAGIGLLMINTGSLFIVLSKLGAGISYRIGQHLALRLPNVEIDSHYSKASISSISDRNVKPSGDVIQCRSCEEWIPRTNDSGEPKTSCSNCGAGSAYLN